MFLFERCIHHIVENRFASIPKICRLSKKKHVEPGYFNVCKKDKCETSFLSCPEKWPACIHCFWHIGRHIGVTDNHLASLGWRVTTCSCVLPSSEVPRSTVLRGDWWEDWYPCVTRRDNLLFYYFSGGFLTEKAT